MAIAYLSLGSNIGDSVAIIKQAVDLLHNEECSVILCSSLYKSEPQGRKDVPWYYNAVLSLDTTYSPHQLLDYTMSIEQSLGRKRTGEVHEPRTIDIDILLFDDITMTSQDLTIPHPHISKRAFVLLPLHEIAPEILIENKTPRDYLATLVYNVSDNTIYQS